MSAAQDKSLMVWYFDKDNNGFYELYIKWEGWVKANPNSSYLFQYFVNVKTIDVKYLDTIDVTNMNGMFYCCSKLTNLNLSNFETSKVTSIEHMFNLRYKDTELTPIVMRKATFTNVTNYKDLFNGISNLTSIIVKDEAAKTFIEARLADTSKTGVTVTIAS